MSPRIFLPSVDQLLPLPFALALMRITTALLFMAHAAVRLANGSVPGFSNFLAANGLPFPMATVYAISAVELSAGLALALGRWVRLSAASLLVIATTGIVLIHARNGWFVGEHGIGGVEYSLSLIAALLTLIAAGSPASNSITHGLGVRR